MRSFLHWTPAYIVNRLRVAIYERRHPDHPWLTKPANEILSTLLKPSDQGLEWGSGRSTIWLAQRISVLTSVEHDPRWHERVLNDLKLKNLTNVQYVLREDGGNMDDDCGQDTAYVMVANNFARLSLDCVLIDGIYRSACALAILEQIKPGGLLILDNANWFLPSQSVSPNSRSIAQGPATADWISFSMEVATWRSIWTSNGVWDTAMWIKPC